MWDLNDFHTEKSLEQCQAQKMHLVNSSCYCCWAVIWLFLGNLILSVVWTIKLLYPKLYLFSSYYIPIVYINILGTGKAAKNKTDQKYGFLYSLNLVKGGNKQLSKIDNVLMG